MSGDIIKEFKAEKHIKIIVNKADADSKNSGYSEIIKLAIKLIGLGLS